jgi:hypothetical protein
MMEAVRTSETSVDNYFTLQYIPEYNSELHTRRRENLKSHMVRHNFKFSQVVEFSDFSLPGISVHFIRYRRDKSRQSGKKNTDGW